MNSVPKISVIMAAFNAEKYIKEAIDSILGQTFNDFEFIIIDDCSVDSTKNIILSYKDPRIRFFENRQNSGLPKSLNRGLELATGEYITRIDADDYSMPERFKKQYEFLNKYQEIAVVGSWTEIINEQNEEKFILKNITDPDIIKWEQILKNQLAHSSVCFRKKVIDDVGRYNEHYKFAQDFDLWFRVSRRNKITNLEEVLTKYRIHGKSTTGTIKTHKEQTQFVSEIIFKNINYYINLDRKDFDLFSDAFKGGKILNFKNLKKVRGIYKNLFDAYIKKENINKEGLNIIYPIFKKNLRYTVIWYLKNKFSKKSIWEKS